MTKKKEPVVVREMSLSDFEKLQSEIESFMFDGDSRFDDDSLLIRFYDDGSVWLSGDFTMHDCKKVII